MSVLSYFLPLAATPSPSPSPASVTSTIGSTLPILDGLIVVTLLIALLVGFQKGIIQPLMTYLFFFFAVFLIYRERVPYLNGVQKYAHANVVLAIFFALIVAVVAGYGGSVVGQALHRMPIARGVDGFLGIFLNLAIAIGVIYFVLCGMIVFDKSFSPVANNTKLTQAQVATLANLIASNPVAATMVDPKDLQKLKDATTNGKLTTLSTVTQLDNLNTFYQDFVKPQLQSSRLAPYVMRFGQKIPFLGRYGASDLPKK